MIPSKIKVIALVGLLGFLAASGSVSSVSKLVTMQTTEDVIQTTAEETTINITYPSTGYLHAFGGRIYIDFLDYLGYSVIVHNQICVRTNSTDNIEYVMFNLTTFPMGTEPAIETVIDYEYPFECCFNKELETGYNYVITATGFNKTVCCEDTIEKLAFVKISQIVTP